MLNFNPIMATDSYKFSHAFSYPEDVTGMYSYIEARTQGKDMIVPLGIGYFVKSVMSTRITVEMVDEAEDFAAYHGDPFNREGWMRVVNEFNGYLPVSIWAAPEGLPIPSGNAIVTVQCMEPGLFWLASYIETGLLRAIWYPTTIASNGFKVKQVLRGWYEKTGADLIGVNYALHDFGARGVTCAEQAMIGGFAHMVNFMGSDTCEGDRFAKHYYNASKPSVSVPATEHSVQCSYGKEPEQQLEYLRNVITKLGKPGGIVSIVIDGYDVYREALALCTELKDLIIESGVKVVFRPDSGEMLEVVPRLLDMQAEHFGFTVNSKGYKKINNVGLLWGDGISLDAIDPMLAKMESLGYAADNIVFGSGGGLLQKVNRDSYKFAMKASAVMKNDVWVGIAKDPITDPGKKSKEGIVTLVHSQDGGYRTIDLGTGQSEIGERDMLQLVYSGEMEMEIDPIQYHNLNNLDQIRKNTGLF